MTTSGAQSEGYPQGGEFVEEAVTLESRFPQLVMPRSNVWPMDLHSETTLDEATEMLPGLVTALSEPVKPATPSQLHSIFSTNPHDRRLPWTHTTTEEGLVYSTGAYDGPKEADGGSRIYNAINYTFDQNGRLVKLEYVNGEHSYQRHLPCYQEFLSYDDEGFLTERLTWSYLEPTITDHFEYTVDEEGTKVPSMMTRIQKVRGDGGTTDSLPMTVDLANYEEWLTTNPNGYASLSREQLEPKELVISDFKVAESRRGILFPHPEQLEHALVMYGDGSYPTPGGETALEYNDRAFAQSGGELGGFLFSLVARSGSMRDFVQNRITGQAQEKWEEVQKSPDEDAEERVGFSFDYDGAGHFHKSHGDVKITKGGLELTLGAAYVGDAVEDQLASAFGKKRGLRSATINVTINQTEREGYFFVDIKEACEKLGISITDEAIADYLSEYFFENEEAPVSSYDRKYGKQPVLWEDAATGVTIDLVTERQDFDTRTELDEYFRHDATAIWGPLPKEVLRPAESIKATPKLKIRIEPTGDPFSEEATKRTDEVLRTFMSRLEESAS